MSLVKIFCRVVECGFNKRLTTERFNFIVLLSSNGRKADLYSVSPRLGRNAGSNPAGSTNYV